jgi:transposase-like protein
MKIQQLKRVEAAIAGMTAAEIATIQKVVSKREGQVEGALVVQQRAASITHCPHCAHEAMKWGNKNDIPRFKCQNPEHHPDQSKVCGKTFNALTGTPLAGLHHLDKHIGHAQCMVDGLTLRKTAKVLGVNKDTALRWRHQFLQSLMANQPQSLTGLVEADETFFLESFKGQRKCLPRQPKKRGTPAQLRGLSREQIPVLVARDRATGQTFSAVVASRSAVDMGQKLLPHLSKDAELMTDGAFAYRTLARSHGVALRVVPKNKKHKTVGNLHINNVNAYDQRLKKWMGRFQGVATKNLPNYLGWHRWLDGVKKRKATARRFLWAAIG